MQITRRDSLNNILTADLEESMGREEHQERQLALLYDAALTLNREIDPRVQLQFLFKIVMKALRADHVSFYRYDEGRDEIRFESGTGQSPEILESLHRQKYAVSEGRGFVSWVAKHREPLFVPDIFGDSRDAVVDPAMRSGMWVPVLREKHLLGVHAALSTRVNAFTPQDERLLILFANHLSVVIEHARLAAEVRDCRALASVP